MAGVADSPSEQPVQEQLPAETRVWKPTARQAAFISEYLVDLNGAQAAIRAGYAPNSANVMASQLLANPNIAAAVEKAKASRAKMTGMTAEHVVHELALLANADVSWFEVTENGELRPTAEAPAGAMRAIKSVKKRTKVSKDGDVSFEVEFQLWDKPGQLKLMGKHAGVAACSDKIELTGKDGGPIEHAMMGASVEALEQELTRLKGEVK